MQEITRRVTPGVCQYERLTDVYQRSRRKQKSTRLGESDASGYRGGL